MLKQSIRVFLSSTGKDLHVYREAVYEAISKMDGVECIRMEDFGATAETPLSTCISKLLTCQVFVGIAGAFYGSTPPGKSKSFTEHEYDFANENDIPKLMFVTENDFPLPATLRENDLAWEKQQIFRKRVLDEHLIDKAETPDKLATNVVTAIHNHIKKPELLLHAPQDSYVVIIENDKELSIDIREISANLTAGLFPFKEARIINKITLIRMSTKDTYCYDFTKGKMPSGVDFRRMSYASYHIGDYPSDKIAKNDEPRFIEFSPGSFGLLIEPSSSNHASKSNFVGCIVAFLNKGKHTIYFEGESNIKLRGGINADIQPNKNFTFDVISDQQEYLSMIADREVRNLQLEEGTQITSRIISEVAIVSRAKDEITINIPAEELLKSGSVAISIN